MLRNSGTKCRMDNLMEDAQNIRKLLPWIESDKEIIHFLRQIPLGYNYIRKQIAIYHFLTKEREQGHNFEQTIVDDAMEIAVISPSVPFKEIKERLSILGNLPNRKEVVLRQLILNNKQVERALYQMYYKRKSSAITESDDGETNINIKMRRVGEGALEVVSSITAHPQQMKTVQNQNPQEQQPSCSLLKPCTAVSSSTAEATTSNVIINKAPGDPAFDLIKYLKEVTHAKENKVRLVCQNLEVPLDSKPPPPVLNKILSVIMDKNPDLIVLDDSRVSGNSESENSEVEEGKAVLGLKRLSNRHQCTSTSSTPKAGPSRKRSIIASARFDPSNSTPSTSRPRKMLLQPAKLLHVPHLASQPQEIPALPQRFLNRVANVQAHQELNVLIDDNEEEEVQAGPSRVTVDEGDTIIDEKLVFRLMEMFPAASPVYIRKVCEGKTWEEFDDLVTVILSDENHPKRSRKEASPPREVSIEEQLEIVKALLPDADPTYLRCKVEACEGDSVRLNEFIVEANETKSYPTMKEYLRKQKLTAQSKQYTSEFNIENFVQLFPEPKKTFEDPDRTVKVDNYTSLYILNYFQNKFDTIAIKTIRSVLVENRNRIVPTYNVLLEHLKANRTLKNKRKRTNNLDDIPQNIAVLQELAYLNHKKEIETLIKLRKEQEDQDRQHAKENNLMNTCRCCYDEEVMPKDTFSCPKGCLFCRSCIRRSCEVAMGENKTVYKCLENCEEEFTYQTLQSVLTPKVFSKLAQKKTVAEAKAAGIELETCPFCEFATIPVENDKIFYCLNEDCMKESCRQCRQENHIPYKCDEVEKDKEVEARTYVENKMTEALIRECYKCGMRFFKEEGCNKMTCTCGAHMCYICKAPVTDYSHFNGLGGDKYHLCPLFSDSNDVNRQNVMGAAEAAKAEIDPAQLKVDPTADIVEHFEQRRQVLPREPHLAMLEELLPHPPIRVAHMPLFGAGNRRRHHPVPAIRGEAAQRQQPDFPRYLERVEVLRRVADRRRYQHHIEVPLWINPERDINGNDEQILEAPVRDDDDGRRNRIRGILEEMELILDQEGIV